MGDASMHLTGNGSTGSYIGSERRLALGFMPNRITGVTSATPQVVTTETAHGYATGDRVSVGGVNGLTGCNGIRTITVLSATTFELDGTTANGAYVAATGVCHRFWPGGGHAVIDHIAVDNRSPSTAFTNVQIFESNYDVAGAGDPIYQNQGLSNGGSGNADTSKRDGLARNQKNGLSVRGVRADNPSAGLYVRAGADQYLQIHWRWVPN